MAITNKEILEEIEFLKKKLPNGEFALLKKSVEDLGLGQNSLKPFAGKEVGPGENIQTNELLEEYIRSKSETAYHPSCTLKMGVDKMSVVDEKLRIYGLQNIRVIDSSIMPEITSGNLNAPTIMIAEKASDIIKGI